MWLIWIQPASKAFYSGGLLYLIYRWEEFDDDLTIDEDGFYTSLSVERTIEGESNVMDLMMMMMMMTNLIFF